MVEDQDRVDDSMGLLCLSIEAEDQASVSNINGIKVAWLVLVDEKDQDDVENINGIEVTWH